MTVDRDDSNRMWYGSMLSVAMPLPFTQTINIIVSLLQNSSCENIIFLCPWPSPNYGQGQVYNRFKGDRESRL